MRSRGGHTYKKTFQFIILRGCCALLQQRQRQATSHISNRYRIPIQQWLRSLPGTRNQPTSQPLHTVPGYVSPTTTKRPVWPDSRNCQSRNDPIDIYKKKELSDSCDSPPIENGGGRRFIASTHPFSSYCLCPYRQFLRLYAFHFSKVFTMIFVGVSFIVARPHRRAVFVSMHTRQPFRAMLPIASTERPVLLSLSRNNT